MAVRPVTLALILFGAVTAAALPGCREEGPAERAGEEIDEAVDDAKDALDDAKDDAEDAVD